jgi:tRNA (Thr-GGU) A37 N-methylase
MQNDDSVACAASFTIIPIGLIHTPFRSATGTPIQGPASNGAQGVVELLPGLIAGLKDLAEFERIWLIYRLDRASPMQLVVRPYIQRTAAYLPRALQRDQILLASLPFGFSAWRRIVC